MTNTQTFPLSYLHDFIVRVLTKLDIPEQDAHQAAEILTLSDLRGIDSHGIARLRTYVGLLNAGRINPHPEIKIVRQTASTATVDGDNGLGLVVGPFANEVAMQKAEEVGSGWVSVRNSNHYGIAGYYPLQALKRDLIGMSMTNASRIVTPLWGAQGMLGTNPIAIAFPGLHEPPIVIDMATSVVAFGKVEIQKRKNEPIPEGWAIDKSGHGTHSPDEMIDHGALLPLGTKKETGGHKGYCLASMVDILSCVLSGANWGPFAPPTAIDLPRSKEQVGKGLGHFFGAWQIEGFIDPAAFKKQIDHWIQVFRSTKPAPGTDGPIIPGDPERKQEAIRRKEGIPLLLPVVDDLRTVAQTVGVSF
ncbi:MAG: Ldh family oxidoreductase [Rhodothermaceae bacterium]|nr:Ldh family oxidoreductase [Rhodothermaceae bacterium]